MTTWRIERLDRSHKRDDFIRTRATQYDKRNLGLTYVAVNEGDTQVLGYYTIASRALVYENLPLKVSEKLPRHPVPVVLLARLAVDQTVHGQRLGERLLVDALRQALELSESIGLHAVEVDATDFEAKAFYAKYGFVSLPNDELHLYLPMETIRASFLNG